MNALDVQVGGTHYKDKPIQPIQYCHANKLGPCESAVVKYITRWKDKGGLSDLQKVKHYVDLLIELEGLVQPADGTTAEAKPVPDARVEAQLGDLLAMAIVQSIVESKKGAVNAPCDCPICTAARTLKRH